MNTCMKIRLPEPAPEGAAEWLKEAGVPVVYKSTSTLVDGVWVRNDLKVLLGECTLNIETGEIELTYNIWGPDTLEGGL